MLHLCMGLSATGFVRSPSEGRLHGQMSASSAVFTALLCHAISVVFDHARRGRGTTTLVLVGSGLGSG